MLSAVFDLARPMLFALPPEQAHEATLRSLEAGFYPRQTEPDHASLAVELWGLRFPNPLGIAAGFDKDARVPDVVLRMGCGFAEVGTVTPKPQPGNPAPRVFRLIADRAIINRLGFNSAGHAAVLQRLRGRAQHGVVGVNLGANKDTTDRAADYVLGLETFYGVASYFTVNISSPNTPGLRDLESPAALDALLGRLMASRARLASATLKQVPITVKLSPDIPDADLAPVVERLLAHKVDGIAVANTTLSRSCLPGAAGSAEAGGLSGRPLFTRSTIMLARVYQLTEARVPLIGIGGIESGESALAKIEAGATLLQLYTGLIYEGPGLIGRIGRHLAAAVRNANAGSIGSLTGSRAAEWAQRPLETSNS